MVYFPTRIKNAIDFLNEPGIIPPPAREFGVKVLILTDDMRASDVVWTREHEGEKRLFTKVFEYTGASRLIGSVFAFSAIALAIF